MAWWVCSEAGKARWGGVIPCTDNPPSPVLGNLVDELAALAVDRTEYVTGEGVNFKLDTATLDIFVECRELSRRVPLDIFAGLIRAGLQIVATAKRRGAK